MDYHKYKKKYQDQKKHIKRISSTIDEDKLKGCIWAALCGDALGSRYEFLDGYQASKLINNDIKDNKLDILGDGPFKVLPGQYSDDAEMTLSLLQSLITTSKYNQDDVAKHYIDWYKSVPIDIGKTIKNSLHTRQISKDKNDMINNSMYLNNYSLSNGVLMRITPIAIYSVVKYLTNEELRTIVNLECDLTHPNIIIKDAVFIYCLAIKYIILNYDKEKLYKKLLEKVTHPRVRIIITDAYIRASPTYIIDESFNEKYVDSDDKKYQGYFGIALQNALYELFYGNDIESSLINIIKRGGDCDTNCCIAGGLLGAKYGYNNIPKNWIKTITSVKLDRYNDYPNLAPNNIDTFLDKLIHL